MIRKFEEKSLRFAVGVACALAMILGLLGQPASAQSPAGDSQSRKVSAHLEKAERDSQAAIAAQIAKLDAFFDKRTEGVPAFAKAVVSDGQLQMAGTLAQTAFKGLLDLVDPKLVPAPTPFPEFVKEAFGNHVFTPDQLRGEIDAVAFGWLAEAKALEGRLLVDIRADLEDGAFNFVSTAPGAGGELKVADQNDALITAAIDQATEYLVVAVTKFAISWVLGDKLGDQIMPPDQGGLTKFGVDLAAGFAVDKALDAAIAQAGYDPEKKLAVKLTASIHKMRNLIVEGDASALADYATLCVLRDRHPNTTVREAARHASGVMRMNANLGLRCRLAEKHAERTAQWRSVLSKLNLGVEPATATFVPSNMPLPTDLETHDPAGYIYFTNEIIRIFGGNSR